MEKPSYSTTKRALWLSLALAWIVIIALAVFAGLGSDQAVAFGAMAVPSMVALIVTILGIHRGFGSLDMYTMARGRPPGPGGER